MIDGTLPPISPWPLTLLPEPLIHTTCLSLLISFFAINNDLVIIGIDVYRGFSSNVFTMADENTPTPAQPDAPDKEKMDQVRVKAHLSCNATEH